MRPVITLLTDFGLTEHYAGAVKGVIATIAPGTQVIDLSHDVPPFDIRGAAYLLYCSYPYFPKRAIHLTIVDPGVGTNRRLLCADVGDRYFLAPDNGVLTLVLQDSPAARLYDISRTRYRLSKVSPTFHGRDILAPCAAQLARGVKPRALGPLASQPLHQLPLTPRWQARQQRLEGEVLHVDRFGNVITTITRHDAIRHFPGALTRLAVRLPKRRLTIPRVARTYGEARSPREPLAIFGSSDFLELALHQGSFHHRWPVRRDEPIWVMG